MKRFNGRRGLIEIQIHFELMTISYHKTKAVVSCRRDHNQYDQSQTIAGSD